MIKDVAMSAEYVSWIFVSWPLKMLPCQLNDMSAEYLCHGHEIEMLKNQSFYQERQVCF